MKHWDKTILAIVLQWDYGIKERGLSLDMTCFVDNLRQLTDKVAVFCYDEYLQQPEKLQTAVLEQAAAVQPDLIFISMFQDQFAPSTLETLKSRYATYAWFGDDQWRFDSYSRRYAPHFTYVSTTDPWSVVKYERLGITPLLTQWAAQPYSQSNGPLGGDEAYRYDISFIGGYNRYRGWFIDQLRQRGIQVECFGAGWPQGRVSYEQMEQIFRTSKINLNISNSVGQDTAFVLSSLRNIIKYYRHPKNAEQIKARNFEIPLAGGFQLSNYVLGLERYLTIGAEIAVYTSLNECVQQIEYYLTHETERLAILQAAHKRTAAEHTYLRRLENILKEIWP